MTEQATRAKGLVNELLRLARTADERSASRAALAELRHAVHAPLRAAPYVAPFLGPDMQQDEKRDDERWFYVVASLFAIHRKHQGGISLGKAFRRIKDVSGGMETRFLQLLSSDGARLESLLRPTIALLDAHDVPLDWHRLLDDLRDWSRDDKRRQHQLARDFYSENTKGSLNEQELEN